MIEIRDLTFSYRSEALFSHLGLTLQAGERILSGHVRGVGEVIYDGEVGRVAVRTDGPCKVVHRART